MEERKGKWKKGRKWRERGRKWGESERDRVLVGMGEVFGFFCYPICLLMFSSLVSPTDPSLLFFPSILGPKALKKRLKDVTDICGVSLSLLVYISIHSALKTGHIQL